MKYETENTSIAFLERKIIMNIRKTGMPRFYFVTNTYQLVFS